MIKEFSEYIKNNNLKRKAEKNSKEPERNPYVLSDYCVLKPGIEHQGIGGKKAYFDFPVDVEEIVRKATIQKNIACENFIRRRPDLFRSIQFQTLTVGSHIIKPEAMQKKYYYVHIWNTNDMIYPGYTYLGYVICSDEIKKGYKQKHE